MNLNDWAPNHEFEETPPTPLPSVARELIELELAQALSGSDLTSLGWEAALLVIGLHGPDGLGAAEQRVVSDRFKRRIESSMRPWDWMRKLDKASWAILVKRVTGWREAWDIAEMTLSILEIPVTIGDKSVALDVSVGVGLEATQSGDPGRLLEATWRAMQKARNSPNKLERAS